MTDAEGWGIWEDASRGGERESGGGGQGGAEVAVDEKDEGDKFHAHPETDAIDREYAHLCRGKPSEGCLDDERCGTEEGWEYNHHGALARRRMAASLGRVEPSLLGST